MAQKLKSLLQLGMLIAAMLVMSNMGVRSPVQTPTASADPIPVCSGGAVLQPAVGDQPAFCSCPTGQFLVTGNPNTCAATCPDGNSTGTDAQGNKYCNAPVPVTTSEGDPAVTSGKCNSTSNCDLIQQYLNPFVNLLAALVGVAVVISIIIGGIQYSSSAGDPQKAAAARNRIRNAIIALITFLFLYAILNFLIPGGLL